MGHYRSNVRDLEFCLDLFGVDDVLGAEPFAGMDRATASQVLAEADSLARTDLADSFAYSDQHPPEFDPTTHTVTMPEPFKKSYQRLLDGEWYRIELPDVLGGFSAPPSLRWAVAELFLGANPPAYMYSSGASFAGVLHAEGTPKQQKLAQLMVEKQWTATMALTEPDAGSDVGAGRTHATQQPDGSWHIGGVKRFITSGEHDLADNIIHFVLARPDGAGPGTKGLSMFLVPKYLIGEDGELGARNGVYATNVEHKMGIKASTTCELTFGEREPAIGYLVGDVHDGIRQMFRIIEYARMLVGTKAIATLSTGYLHALEYAKTRMQGPDLTRAGDATAPRVTIIHHPDVRRSLLRQKAYAEGLRALVMFTASIQDRFAAADGEEAKNLDRLNDLLLPILKGCGSERSYEMLGSETLQTFGGSGYLVDYPIEQYVRDAKIDTLYEGTTAIQGLDLFFRKIVRDNGQAMGMVADRIGAFVTAHVADGELGDVVQRVARAAVEVQTIVETMTGWARGAAQDPSSLYLVGLNTSRLLLAMGDLLIGWLLTWQAIAARSWDGGDASFVAGKAAAARFFAHTVLPEVTARRVMVVNTDLTAMELPEAAF